MVARLKLQRIQVECEEVAMLGQVQVWHFFEEHKELLMNVVKSVCYEVLASLVGSLNRAVVEKFEVQAQAFANELIFGVVHKSDLRFVDDSPDWSLIDVAN